MNRTAMRTKRGYTRVWLAALGFAAGASVLAGCELLVDFDRSKIPTAGQGDASLLDGGGAPELDGSVDGLAPDGGSDAAGDAPIADGATDGAGDGATDAATSDAATTDGATADSGATDGAADADDGAAVSDASDDGG